MESGPCTGVFGGKSFKLMQYGFTPMILDTDTAATMHSDQERIPVAEFLNGIHIFYDLLTSQF